MIESLQKKKNGFKIEKKTYPINWLDQLEFSDFKNLQLIEDIVNLKNKINKIKKS